MQFNVKAKVATLTIAAAVVSLVVTTVPAFGANASPKGDLVLVRNQDFATWDPDLAQNDSLFIQEQLYEPLFMVTNDGKDVKPWLALSAKASADKTTWTIKLRTDVKFSNGQQMTSKDVKFSIDRATKGNGWGFLNTAISSVSATAPDTVVIKTSFPWAPLISDLSCFSNAILPANFAGKSEADFFNSPIGTGPFTFDHRTPGTEVKLVANKNYWQPGKPYLNSVTWKYVVDDNTRELMLKAGQADINEFPSTLTLANLRKNTDITVTAFPAAQSRYMLINEKMPQLQDVHVRRAISYAIDRQSIIRVLGNEAFASNSILAPGVQYYSAKAPGISFNMGAAKREMSLSKYKKGFDLEYLVLAGNADDNATASIIQASLKQIGINVKLVSQEPKVHRATRKAMTYQIANAGWTMDISDPDELLTFALSPEGGTHQFYTNYLNPSVVKWVKKGQVSMNPAVRQAYYNQVQNTTAKEAMLGYLYNAPYVYAWSNKLTGFEVTPLLNYHMEDVKKG